MNVDFFKRNQTQLLTLVALGVYNGLFFREQLGINLLLFTLLLFIFLFYLHRERFTVKWLMPAAVTLLITTAVVWHHSLFSLWMFFISFLVMLGFVLQPTLRSTGMALLTALSNVAYPPFEIFSWEKKGDGVVTRRMKTSRLLGISLIPLLVALLFFIIYRTANPVFADITDHLLTHIEHWITRFFETISVARILFLILGLFIISGILFVRRNRIFKKEESQYSDHIPRVRKRIARKFLNMEFRHEYISGMVLLVLVNAMLLLLNSIDIRYIWVNFTIPEGISLKQMVHEGTEWLIASILISLVVLAYLFRANQNFYSRNMPLKILASLWVAQNMLLTVSLILRNNQYVAWHALAYKRLGLYAFILLVFVGLVTMLVKIHKGKSLFYLVRINSLVAYLFLGAAALINWDGVIASYNIQNVRGSQVDTDFLLKLSPKVYPYLYQHLDKIEMLIKAHGTDDPLLQYDSIESFTRCLDEKSRLFLASREEVSWRSYTVLDERARQYLLTMPRKTP